MARSESDREDLLREATALVERIELQVAGFDEPIVAGFRRDGSASFFFGADPVYQFNAAGELRRAYIEGLLYKAEQGRLVVLRRVRGTGEVVLERTELGCEAAQALFAAARAKLAQLETALSGRSFQITGQIPPDCDLVSRIQPWLRTLPPHVSIAARPHVR